MVDTIKVTTIDITKVNKANITMGTIKNTMEVIITPTITIIIMAIKEK